jgi:mxaA protein
MKRTCLVLMLLFSGTATAAEELGPVKDFQVLTPRPFGYAIGDVIRQTLVIAVDREVALDRNSLPRSRINRWLELREANVQESERDGLRRYSIELAYQSFYAPLEVKNLAIPAFKLAFTQAGSVFELEVPAWRFTMAPIRELSVLRGDGLEPMRPDAPPEIPGRSGAIRGLASAAAVGGGTGLYLAYLYGYLPWQQRGRHFRAACRTVRALSRASGEPDYSSAYAAIHRAFNGVYGQPLFSEHLGAFFSDHPPFEALRAEIEAFFASSYEFFFGERSTETRFPMSRLFRLCRDCYDVERNLQ